MNPKAQHRVKILTLNTHSWLEEHQPDKIRAIARAVTAWDCDVLALQEVNQLREGPATVPSGFLGPSSLPIRRDHFARLLVEALAELGASWEWAWAEAHVGFGRYDEGVAVLVRKAPESPRVREVRSLLLGDYPYENVRRRVAVAVLLEEPASGRRAWLLSGHFSWWDRPVPGLFAEEWRAVEGFAAQEAEPVLVAGDLNNPAGVPDQGYRLVTGAGWQDARDLAAAPTGDATVSHAISGWEDNGEGLRIDVLLGNAPLTVRGHDVVFDGSERGGPVVSDHCGVLVDLDFPQTMNQAREESR